VSDDGKCLYFGSIYLFTCIAMRFIYDSDKIEACENCKKRLVPRRAIGGRG